MISPHPPRLRMKRRKTVSVTPAMGASTVAGAIRTFPIVRDEGTGIARVVAGDSPAPAVPRNVVPTTCRTDLPILPVPKNKAPAKARA